MASGSAASCSSAAWRCVGAVVAAMEPFPRRQPPPRPPQPSRIVLMMSSGSSTDRGATRRDSTFQPWHFYILLSLAGATGAVIVSRNTHPAALIMLSASIVAAGLVGAALHS